LIEFKVNANQIIKSLKHYVFYEKKLLYSYLFDLVFTRAEQNESRFVLSGGGKVLHIGF
jgi:hypothetical protein